MEHNHLLLGTAKGLIIYKKTARGWKYDSDHFLGISVSMALKDTHSGHWWVSLDHKHWGPKLQYSEDHGRSWLELDSPKYPESAQLRPGVPATLRYIWTLAFGIEPGTIYVGTEPGGLFVSRDHGRKFKFEETLWNHPSRQEHWFGGGRLHPGIHSIVTDPQDREHIYIGVSCAGVFETIDGGNTWEVRNRGLRADYLPNPQVEVGHDPHLLLACKAAPQVMWQQNHCGIYRSTNSGSEWTDVTDPQEKGRYGFTLGIDHDDPLTAWVVPATSDAQRIAVGQSLFVLHTRDGGLSWQEQRKGLPQKHCFDIVLRHALDVRDRELALGTSGGSLFVSEDAGNTWESVNHHLPRIFSVKFA